MHDATHYLHCGRDSEAYGGLINTPVFRGSTVLAKDFNSWEASKKDGNPYANYGRFGTPTTRAFEDAMAGLEGGQASLVFPSGLAACVHALLAFVSAGDHVLITDNIYGPTRTFVSTVLTRLGVEVEFFAPAAGAGIARQLRPTTRVVFTESPGSLTFEVCDLPAICQAAHSVGAFVLLDNTWASPLYFKPFEHGVDVSIQAATKYIVGHSDALLGVATANERAWPLLKAGAHDFGQTASPDDLFLALRGLRTLPVRLQRHWSNGVTLARSLEQHPLVTRVMHPALPNDPGHDLWKRDFLGASGLFGIEVNTQDPTVLARLFDNLKLFGIGLSWGGFESLVVPVGHPVRQHTPAPLGYLIRVHAGLEHVDDLVLDFQRALDIAVQKPCVAVA
ncbi:cystathionine beta-lyase [Pseudomonas lundensis]|uniref:Cystathionine beta-lyase n=1 Tax=Pseudomonas lundensis TaxID=86185 RepID=A0AAX2HAH9_9PSED|nr:MULTISPECIES: cystathionine beta-lyase [Pseudomonas]MCT8955064.1 cystathionine beta-lyase [Pseudomonas lundensis]NNA37393.1 cystathionine beta-lyase [Pseudomonas lundensis]SOB53838.1 putative cystathionine beta-lyase [Pseudomonas lundensis]HCS07494.1 cystathionine beta-lyase [Pseudomonas sp.]